MVSNALIQLPALLAKVVSSPIYFLTSVMILFVHALAESTSPKLQALLMRLEA